MPNMIPQHAAPSPRHIAAGLGDASRQEICGLLAMLNAVRLTKIASAMGEAARRKLVTDDKPAADRVTVFANELMDGPVPTDALRARLWLSVKQGLGLPGLYLLSTRGLTRQSIGAIQRHSLSHYQFIDAIFDHISKNAPAVMTSYNGIRYDEEVLRHSFYANLREPYVTQWSGNTRMDVFVAAKVVAVCAPHALNMPANASGKRSFRLEHLASANGLPEHDTHDALDDVRATMHVAHEMFERSPQAWEACAKLRCKNHVLELVQSGEPLVSVDWDHNLDGPQVQTLLPICSDDVNPNEWLCVNLNSDVNRLLAADAEALRAAFNVLDGVKGIVRVKVNAMPALFRRSDPVVLGLGASYDPWAVIKLRSNAGLVLRLKAAAKLRKSEFECPARVAEQLYSGGFFPVRADKLLLRRFHQAAPHEKFEMIADLSDPRARHMARWLVGSEWPEVLPKGDRQGIADEFREHLMQEQAIWTTIPSALRQIKRLITDASPQQIAILEEYEGYPLNRLGSMSG